MQRNHIKAMQQDHPDIGKIRVQVQSAQSGIPVKDAVISILETGKSDNIFEQVKADNSGMSEIVDLAAPPVEYSLEPKHKNKPYSEYTCKVEAAGYEDITITGVQILSNETAILPVHMRPVDVKQKSDKIVIPAHTLYGKYPPKIAEAEIKSMNQTEEFFRSRVVIPEFVLVHDGAPRDKTAKDYYIRYKDYIKNVASGAVYATWPLAAITANILAIMSFTLNRAYTQWYRNKGFDFTVTSSSAFDYKWVYGRNIYQNISLIVDEIFSSYLSRPNVKQPILVQYCDGERIRCPSWMSLWESGKLSEQGYSVIEILRHYYGDTMYINTAEGISGVPVSWPGYDLSIGSEGPELEQIQRQINAVSEHYSIISKIKADGIYGTQTQNAVRKFEEIFGLPKTGIIDYRSWYKVQEIYVGVKRTVGLYK